MESKKLTYKELKSYFETNEKSLPRKVGNDFMLVTDVVECYKIQVRKVEAEIKKGVDPSTSITAKAAKGVLQNLYEMVIDPKTHDVSEFRKNPFSNYHQ